MGRVIYAYRHHSVHGPRGLFQTLVAQWLHLDQPALSRLEKSKITDLQKLIQWARVLQIPSELLWFSLPEKDASPRSADPNLASSTPKQVTLSDAVLDLLIRWEPGDTVDMAAELTKKDLTIDRRELSVMFAKTVLGASLLEPLERWLYRHADPRRSAQPGQIGYQEVEQIEIAARMFREWDQQLGGGLRRKAVVGQLNEVADLLKESYPEAIKKRLFGAMAQLSATSATMSWDSGNQALAQNYYFLAIRAARSAGEINFGGNVLAGLSRQLLYLGEAGVALEFIRLAQDYTKHHATARMQALLFVREAWAYAKLNRVSAFRRATEKAENAFSEIRKSDNDPFWLTYFDLAELEGTTGGRLFELAHENQSLAQEAANRIEHAIRLRQPERFRSSALDSIGLAEARLINKDLDECARLGHEAVDAVGHTPSQRVRIKLAEFYKYTETHASHTEMSMLRDRMKSVLVAND